MYRQIHCSNSCPILELSVKFASQICHENINKPVDGDYLADFGIDISMYRRRYPNFAESFRQQAKQQQAKLSARSLAARFENNNKDVFRGHGHTKTRVKTTIVDVAALP